MLRGIWVIGAAWAAMNCTVIRADYTTTCEGYLSSGYLSRNLPLHLVGDPCLSSANCLRTAAEYWGKSAPPESRIGLEILKKAHDHLGNSEFIASANRGLAYPLSHPLSVAEEAVDLGLRAQIVTKVPWEGLMQYVANNETILVLWEYPSPRWSLVKGINLRSIRLVGPSQDLNPDSPYFLDMTRWDFQDAWNLPHLNGGTIIRITP